MSNHGEIEMAMIATSDFNPRKMADDKTLTQLVASIKKQGVLQPIIVRERTDSAVGTATFEVVCGERRYKAALFAGLKTIPAIVRDLTDAEALDLALVENLQREDMNPMDEARALQIALAKHEPKELADRIGKPAAYVARSLKLLALPEKVQAAIASGQITAGHGHVLARLADSTQQIELCRAIVREKWSVKRAENELERLANELEYAQFDTADCVKCEHNGSRQKDLFDRGTNLKGRCLNVECFAAKRTAHVKSTVDRLRKKGERVATVAEIEKNNPNFSKWNTMEITEATNKMLGENAKKCASCPDRIHVVDNDGVSERCLKPRCYASLTRKRRGEYDGDDAGNAKQVSDTKKENRVHEARTAFWQAVLTSDRNQDVLLTIMANAMLRTIPHAVAIEILKNHGITVEKDAYHWDIMQLFSTGHGQELPQAVKIMEDAAVAYIDQRILQYQHGTDAMRDMAALTGHDIAKEWVMTEQYLQSHLKDELATLAKELGIEKGLPDSKADRIAHIMKHAPKGKVPKELVGK